MNDQARGEEMGWFRRVITIERAVAIICAVFTAGMWLATINARDAGTQEQITQLREEVRQLKLHEENAAAERLDVRVNRAEVTVKLVQISADIAALRDEVKEIKADVKNEVRKIR